MKVGEVGVGGEDQGFRFWYIITSSHRVEQEKVMMMKRKKI